MSEQVPEPAGRSSVPTAVLWPAWRSARFDLGDYRFEQLPAAVAATVAS